MEHTTLILGAGAYHNRSPGETLVDVRPFPNVDVVHNLDNIPWPWEDSSMTRIVACHLVEHLHCLLVPFMDECWRILRPGGSVYIETPHAGDNPDLEWSDPTHVRCYRKHSFINYFTPEGIARFGYTSRGWNLAVIKAENGILIVHAFPLKQ